MLPVRVTGVTFSEMGVWATVRPLVHALGDMVLRLNGRLEAKLTGPQTKPTINRISQFRLGAGQWAVVLIAVTLSPLRASAQGSSAQLAVNLTVQSSISLVFQNNPSVGSTGFCPLTNPGTNNVGLDLGTASFTGGASLACVNWSRVGPATYQVTSGFDVVVNKANTSSPNYQLAASLSSAPPANVTWLINNTTLSTAFATFQTTNTYATPVTETLKIQVKNNVPAQILQETISFLATAN